MKNIDNAEILPPTEFYNSLDDRYDIMTRDATRWESVGKQYQQIFKDYSPKTILDAGCGTGGEAIALAKIGYSVLGIDGSQQFIEIARSKSMDKDVVFNVDDLRSLETVADNSMDMVICRGNTLPHMLTLEDMKNTINSFRRVCRPNGLLIIQWLNYRLVLAAKRREIGTTGDANNLFLRFYDFVSDSELTFNTVIMRYDQSWKSNWIATTLRPWSADDVGMLLTQAGWKDLQITADIQKSDFEPDKSNNVVLFAHR